MNCRNKLKLLTTTKKKIIQERTKYVLRIGWMNGVKRENQAVEEELKLAYSAQEMR